MKNIKYNKHKIIRSDIEELRKSTKQDLITGGKYLKKLEDAVCKKFNVRYSSLCNSGTSALYLAFKSIDIKKNDIVILPSINFVASSNILKLFDAKIILCDVNENTGQIDIENLQKCIKQNKIKKIKALVTMYLGGSVEFPEKFYALKKKHNFFIIEDACHAIGSKYKFEKKNYYIGSCKHADICTFSLHPIKNITAGEGGIVTTNNKKIFKKIKLHLSHGIVRKNDKYYSYDVILSGLNFRLSEINCALAFSQFKRVDSIARYRNNLAKLYLNYFKNSKNLTFVKMNKNNFNSHHLLICLVKGDKANVNLRDKLLRFLISKKIYPQINYIPIYKFKNFKHLRKFDNTGSEKYFNSCLSLPLHLELKRVDINYICNIISDFFKNKH